MEEAAAALPRCLQWWNGSRRSSLRVNTGVDGPERATVSGSTAAIRREIRPEHDWRQSAKSRSPSFEKTNGNQPEYLFVGRSVGQHELALTDLPIKADRAVVSPLPWHRC